MTRKLNSFPLSLFIVVLFITSLPSRGKTGKKVSNQQLSPEKNVTSSSQKNNNTTLLGRWAEGKCKAVDMVGDTAYFGNGGYLMIADISDKSNPQEISRLLTSSLTILDITINGNNAYVVDGTGLTIIDISDPENPTKTGSFTTEGSALKVTVNNDYAYIADKSGGMKIIDVSAPDSPSKTGHIPTEDKVWNVIVNDSCAYLADGMEDLKVIDISDPNNPTQISAPYIGGITKDVALKNQYLYVTADFEGLRIFDVSQPDNPTQEDTLKLEGDIWRITVKDNYAYVTEQMGNIKILDISEPCNPTLSGSFNPDNKGHTEEVIVNEGYAYVAENEAGLMITNVSNPDAPTQTGSFDTEGDAHHIDVKGDHAYVIDDKGLKIIDISNPANLNKTGSIATAPWPSTKGVTVHDKYAYVAEYSDGMKIVNITDPDNPTKATQFAHNEPGNLTQTMDVVVDEGYAYTADAYNFIKIVQVYDPERPSLYGSYYSTIEGRSIAIKNDYAYIAGDDGIKVIDVSDPYSFSLISSLVTEGHTSDILIKNDHAYVAENWGGGLKIIDISDPKDLTIIDSLYTENNPLDLAMNAGYLYVTDSDGLKILDISDPKKPTQVGSFYTAGSPGEVAASKDNAYMAYEGGGVYIIKNDHDGRPQVANPIPDTTVNRNAPDTKIDLSEVFKDVDNDDNKITKLIYNIEKSSLVTGKIEDNTLILNIRKNQFGRSEIIIRGESNGKTVDDKFQITVLPEDLTFISTLPDTNIRKDEKLEWHFDGLTPEETTEYRLEKVEKYSNGEWNPKSNIEGVSINSSGKFVWSKNTEQEGKYRVIISVTDGIDKVKTSAIIEVSSQSAVQESNQGIPDEYTLENNYPNPFNPITTIKYSLPEKSNVKISIYNMNGRKVETLIKTSKEAGYHQIKWNASDVASGVYFYRINAENFTEVKKCVLIK